MVTRSQVVAEARTWVDVVPFKHQGRTRRGVDCVGLCASVAGSLGLSSYDFLGYEPVPGHDPQEFLCHFRDSGCREVLPWTRARPGDMLVFAESLYPCHVGILTEREGLRCVVHALKTYGRVRETQLSEPWRRKVRFAFEFPNIED